MTWFKIFMAGHETDWFDCKDFTNGGQGRLYFADIASNRYVLKVYSSRLKGQDRIGQITDHLLLMRDVPPQIQRARMVDRGTVIEWPSNASYSAALFNFIDGEQLMDQAEDVTSFLQSSSASPRLRMNIACQLVDGVRYLHSKNIIHCDLSPTNVMLNRATGDITIIDLDGGGIWNRTENNWKMPPIVKGQENVPGFPPPSEYWRNLVFPQTDYWWTAMLVFYILFANTPFFFLENNTPPAIQELKTILSNSSEEGWPPTYEKASLHSSYRKIIGAQDYKTMKRYINGRFSSNLFLRTFCHGYDILNNRITLEEISSELLFRL